MNHQLELEDRERLAFLKRLDAAPFEVTEWEAGFLDSLLTRGVTVFTQNQRNKIDQMRKAYEARL